MSVPIPTKIPSLILERELNGRSLSSSVNIARGLTTLSTSVTSCMGILTIDKEPEAEIPEQQVMLGENSPMRGILMKLFHLCQDLIRNSLSS